MGVVDLIYDNRNCLLNRILAQNNPSMGNNNRMLLANMGCILWTLGIIANEHSVSSNVGKSTSIMEKRWLDGIEDG
jgi:hypothetical protein